LQISECKIREYNRKKKTKRTLILSIENFFTAIIRALDDKEFLLEKGFLKCKTLEFKSIFPSLKNKIRKTFRNPNIFLIL